MEVSNPYINFFHDTLKSIRNHAGTPLTTGLPDDVIIKYAKQDPNLLQLLISLTDYFRQDKEYLNLFALPELEAIKLVNSGILNFYPEELGSPFIPYDAKGPWIVTAYGAVIYDAGGYGMLGLGHNPHIEPDLHVMANVMTPSKYRYTFVKSLQNQIGKRGCPYHKFLFMNSGSESMSVALRISDLKAKQVVSKDGPKPDFKPKFLCLKGSFHGRTGGPARASFSTRRIYKKYLRSFDKNKFWSVTPNDCESLIKIFDHAKRKNVHIEAVLLEPVMGEGNPGLAITPEFYNLAVELAHANHGLVIADSIQAGLRCTGNLSIVDYPGFEGSAPPDMETFSKALNAGQYPLSVLALTESSSLLYRPGLYGNTMTGNPAAMDIGAQVLQIVDSDIKNNIVKSGKKLLKGFEKLKLKYPCITKVQGTGLLLSMEFDKNIKVYGINSLEESIRKSGLNIIHGGKNSLRFTPWFELTNKEIDLILEILDSNIALAV